jgi:hypothetical protein
MGKKLRLTAKVGGPGSAKKDASYGGNSRPSAWYQTEWFPKVRTKYRGDILKEVKLRSTLKQDNRWMYGSGCFAEDANCARHQFSAPSRRDLVCALEELCQVITTKVGRLYRESSFVSICADASTSAGRHVAANTAGNPGLTIYMNNYENLSVDDAIAKRSLKRSLRASSPAWGSRRAAMRTVVHTQAWWLCFHQTPRP